MSDKRDDRAVTGGTGGTAMASEVELLSTSVGQIEGKTTLILAFRLDPERTFQFQNLGLSRGQARRLFDDLSQLFQTSAMLNEPEGLGSQSVQERNTQNG